MQNLWANYISPFCRFFCNVHPPKINENWLTYVRVIDEDKVVPFETQCSTVDLRISILSSSFAMNFIIK